MHELGAVFHRRILPHEWVLTFLLLLLLLMLFFRLQQQLALSESR
jgi:hypothetical protein